MRFKYSAKEWGRTEVRRKWRRGELKQNSREDEIDLGVGGLQEENWLDESFHLAR